MSGDYEKLVEKNGYLRCKVDVSDLIMVKYRSVHERISVLRKEIDALEVSIEKQKKISEYLVLLGEANSLFALNKALSACVPTSPA